MSEFGYVENQSTRKSDRYIHKASSHSAILYDVTNGIAVDFLMRPYRYSEIPLAIEHLERTEKILHGRKIIYLADRYYDSVELFRLQKKKAGIIELIMNVIGLADKLKVPVRPDRHEMRWGRIVSVSKPARFRIDGRNWPNTIRYKHILITLRP